MEHPRPDRLSHPSHSGTGGPLTGMAGALVRKPAPLLIGSAAATSATLRYGESSILNKCSRWTAQAGSLGHRISNFRKCSEREVCQQPFSWQSPFSREFSNVLFITWSLPVCHLVWDCRLHEDAHADRALCGGSLLNRSRKRRNRLVSTAIRTPGLLARSLPVR